jgi:hypothetical protein
VPLSILRDPYSRTAVDLDIVAFDDQHGVSVIGKNPRGHQAGDAATQHASGVEQLGDPRRQICSGQAVEHGAVYISHHGMATPF